MKKLMKLIKLRELANMRMRIKNNTLEAMLRLLN
jgi:hypothetical protein